MQVEARSLLIAQTWDGQPAPRVDWVRMDLTLGRHALVVDIDAPFHGGDAPNVPVGHTPGLWNHEVVELFLLGSDERYLEIEFGPHGHHLVLELRGPRRVVQEHTALDYTAQMAGERFVGHAEVPLHWLPAGLDRINAYAIHGTAASRQYLAWRGAPGVRPDFHRLDTFGKLGFPSLSAEVTVPSAGSARARARARARA
jgi:hypothetical protein